MHLQQKWSPVHRSTSTHPLETRGAPEALETQRPANESAQVELRFHILAPQVDNRQDVPERGVIVDVEVLGVEAGDEELQVLTDFDNGAIRLWQVSPGSHRRYLFPLGLCEGNHSVAAWAFDRNGILSSHATSLIPTEKPPVDRHQGIPISVSTPTNHRSSASDHVDGSDELRRKRCDPSERQPPLLMGGRDRIGGDRTLCRVCAIDPLDSSAPVVQIRYGHEGGAVRPRCRSGKPRRLVLSTSLRVVTDTSGGEKGSSSHIWPIELWEGDSPASISRQFVATRLGMRVRPEGPTPPVIAEPQSSGDSFKFLVEDDEEGERTVQWLTQRLEIEISTRQAHRRTIRAEASRRISETRQLRVVLGAGVINGSKSVKGDWLMTDKNTLDVTDAADFESVLGIDGFADAFLAEHVWEHLSLEDAHRATRNCYRFLRPGGRLRLAVPDPDWYLFPLKSGARNSGEKQSQASQSPGEAGSLPGKANGHRDRKKRKAEKVARRASSRELPVWLSFAMVAADIRDGHLVQYTPELLANVCWSAGFKPILVEGGSRIRGRRPMSKRHVHGEDEDGRSLKAGLSDEGAEGSWFRPDACENDVEGDVDSSLWGFVKRSVAGGDPRGSYSIVMDCVKPAADVSDSGASDNGSAISHLPESTRQCMRTDGTLHPDDSTPQHAVLEISGRLDEGSVLMTAASTAISGTDSCFVGAHNLIPQEVGYDASSIPADVASRNIEGVHGTNVVSGGEGRSPCAEKHTRAHAVPSENGPTHDTLRRGDEISPTSNEPVFTVNSLRRHRQNASLVEWATAAQEIGRVCPPCDYGEGTDDTSDSPSDAASMATMPSNTSGHQCSWQEMASNFPINRGCSPHNVAEIRANARKFLLAGDLVTTFTLCESILSLNPSDSVALLYQGAAFAKRGEWTLAGKNMERVLALSFGADNYGEEDEERSRQSWNHRGAAKEQRASLGRSRISPDTTLAAVVNLASFARLNASKTRDPSAETFFLLEGIRIGGSHRDLGKYVGGEQADMMHAAASSDDGLIDILFMTARDFEEQGQLTAALRLYQRVVLLGGHQQKRILQGFGKVSQRLKQLQHSRRDVTSFPRPPPVVFSPAHADAPSARGAASSPAEIAHNHCEWSIIRPTSYQVFSPEAVIHVEFDLARLDPGVPIIGSLFASTRAHDVPGTTASVAATGVGFFVCSYLDRFQLPNCLPRAELRDLKLGWHVLTAEVFVLPSLEPLLCGHGGHSAADSVRTTRFCVGDDKICRQKRTDQVFHAAKGHNQPPQQPLNVVRTTTIPTQAAAGAEGEPPREGHQGPDPSTTGETATGEVELPFCFLTLALNALPFLTHHISVFREAGSKLSLRASFAAGGGPTEAGLSVNATDSTGYIPTPPESFWEWHIVEGVAVGRADHRSPYDHKPIPGRFYDSDTGLSIDGTTQYLNSIRDIGAEQVYIHRRCAEKTNGETAGGDVPETAIHGTSQRKGKSRGGGHACYTTTGEETSYFWRDKIEMVNAAVFSMERECLLVQIDSDELWTADQLIEIRDMFLQEREQAAIARGNITGLNNKSAENNRDGRPNDARTSETSEQGDASDGEEQRRSAPTRKARECAYFDCHFFVGPNLVTVTEDGWGHSTSSEWLRAWIFRPSESLWLRHAPPELARHGEASGWRLLVGDACVSREETRQRGLVFTHYAYALEKQVQFKSEFYGHSAQRSSLKGVESVADANAVVSEWKALQDIEPPVVLAEHLTWLRYQGHHQEPRLLTTVADRPRPKSRVPLHGDGHRGYADARGQSVEGQATQSDEVAVIPLEPFLGEIDAWTAEDVLRDVDSIGAESGGQSKGSTSSCQHESMGRGSCEHDRRLRVSGGRLNGGEGSRETLAGTVSCDSLHLVVDGAIFQADVGMLKGIARVWTNLIPTILSRLHGFEGTCLTLLIRGLAPPPSFLIKAFEGLPPERYSWTHIPPYNPSFGFLSDQLLLSGIVRRIAVQKGNGVSDYEKTAFISTMYTQPFWATTPGVLRVVLIHDLIPEIFEWDKSEGVWLTAHKADTATSASAVVAVSQHTAREFLRIYPRSSERAARLSTDTRPVWAAHNGVDTTMFYPVGRSKIDAFRNIASLDSGTPYVLIVGSRLGYKNAGTVYRAMTAANTPDARTTIALVLIGGGPVTPEELDALDGVRHWTHIGFGSVEEVASKTTVSAVVDDDLLAAAYSGAVALIQMSIGEGFGLTVLEAFACGCPVVASDIPPFREIAGLPERQQQHFVHELRKDTSTAAEARKAEGNPMGSTRSTNSSKEWARSLEGSRASTNERYGGAASSLGGGLILVDNPVSATQVWRALRALRALDNDRRDQISELLVKRAGHFDSWQPLADMLVKAAVRVK